MAIRARRGPAGVGATPLPRAAVFTHVQPHTPDFCATTGITACEQIVQSTAVAGSVDYAFFFQPTILDPTPLTSLDLTVEWPSQWNLLGSALCCGEGTAA